MTNHQHACLFNNTDWEHGEPYDDCTCACGAINSPKGWALPKGLPQTGAFAALQDYRETLTEYLDVLRGQEAEAYAKFRESPKDGVIAGFWLEEARESGLIADGVREALFLLPEV